MRVWIIAAIAGIGIPSLTAHLLPFAVPALVLVAALTLVLLHVRVRWCALAFALGLAWSWGCFAWGLAHRLPVSLEGRDIAVSGQIASLPAHHHGTISFDLAVTAWAGDARSHPRRIHLTWYRARRLPQPGEEWRLRVRLKRPHALMDPGAFDYAGWSFRRGIDAVGYVRHGIARRVTPAHGYWILRWRATVEAALRSATGRDPARGLLEAVTVGDRADVSTVAWQTLIRTGTVHLVAISGLHIGLVAGLVFTLVGGLWRRSRLSARLPARSAAIVAALAVAVVYAALAGFSLPTRRAVFMLAAFALAALWRREHGRYAPLELAALAILVSDPPAVLAPGFWLSCVAVAALLYVASVPGRTGRVRRWLGTQWRLTLGLLPLLALIFGRMSTVGPAGNLFAVPMFAFWIVPAALVGAVLAPLWPEGAALAFHTALWGVHAVMPVLGYLAALPWAQLSLAQPPPWALVAAVLGTALLLAPRGLPGRWLGLGLCVPLFWPPVAGPGPGAFSLTLLDVGQGLAAVVQTRRHTLIYDTGPSYHDGRDAARSVVIPYLRAKGIGDPDMLVVSHEDDDHAGGLATLQAAFPQMQVRTGARDIFHQATPCLAGQHWRWDDVDFAVLSPRADGPGHGNDASCVLKISSGHEAALLTGDIEAPAEHRLLARYGAALSADVLVVPHHGSTSSSTAAFVGAVHPAFALFAVGYLNRWRFPKAKVVARYRQLGATLLRTDTTGAVGIRFSRAGVILDGCARQTSARPWTMPAAEACKVR